MSGVFNLSLKRLENNKSISQFQQIYFIILDVFFLRIIHSSHGDPTNTKRELSLSQIICFLS